MPVRKSKIDVSMFPFLSVLCSVIGILVLFIVLVLSTRVVVESEKYQRTKEYDRRPVPGTPGALQEGVDPAAYERLEADLQSLGELVVRRKADRDRLRDRLAALEDLLEFKKTEVFITPTVVRPPEFDKPKRVAMVPDQGEMVGQQPIFIEISNKGYLVHPEKRLYPPLTRDEDAPKATVFAVDAALEDFLEQVDSRRQREYLVLLLHPNGIAPYYSLRSYLATEFSKIKIGYEPFSREWVFAEPSP